MAETDKDAATVTKLLLAWSGGDEVALEKLVPLVYERLQRIAGKIFREERGDHTLQTTALVHEAYLRLLDMRRIDWRCRAQLYAILGTEMRRILVDHARERGSYKRGGDQVRVPVEVLDQMSGARPISEVLALAEALEALAEQHPEAARVVELRHFGGLTAEEIREVTGMSSATIQRRWQLARAFLFRELSTGTNGQEKGEAPIEDEGE